MKFLISILLIPAEIAAFVTAACWAFYFFCHNSSLASDVTPGAHTLKAFLYSAIGIGLPGAVFCTVYCIVLAALSFIFKSWTKAIFSLAIATGGVYVWNYFLNIPYPGGGL